MEVLSPKDALDHFVIERKNYGIRPLVQGYINDTYRIMDGEEPVYLLQRINSHVFPDIPALMHNLEVVLPYLKGEDYHPVAFMYTKSRRPYYRDEQGQFWRLMTYVSNGVSYNFSSDPVIAFEAGKLLGLFHKLTGKVPSGSINEILPGFHDLEKRKNEFLLAENKVSPERKIKARNEAIFAKKMLRELEINTLQQLPVRVCHNDTKLNNFLFATDTAKGLCLIDLDTVMPGFLHFDTGDAIRTLANPCPEDETDLKKISFDLNMVGAFLEGLKESKLKISTEEIQAIIYGTLLMPFLHGIRALTDYFNGDLHYRVTYPDQNLDRCRSLFAFVDRAWEKQAQMYVLIEEILGN